MAFDIATKRPPNGEKGPPYKWKNVAKWSPHGENVFQGERALTLPPADAHVSK